MTSEFAIRRLRTPKEIATAAEMLEALGYGQCAACARWVDAGKLVPDRACHVELCQPCREAEEVALFCRED